VYLYASGRAQVEVAGAQVVVKQATNYPWDGKVQFAIDPGRSARFAVALRIPGWCCKAAIAVNGKAVRPVMKRGYAYVTRTWAKGDRLTLDLPMEVQLIQTHPACRNNIGKVAVQRGPIVYCAEQTDNGENLAAIQLSATTVLRPRFEPRLLGGVVTLRGTATLPGGSDWDGQLYRPLANSQRRQVPIKLVPYCVWGNRKVGKMQAWFAVA
jgi:DUF1680 family protein